VVFLCNAGQRHPCESVRNNRNSVNVEWSAAYSPTFQPRSAHPRLHAFGNQRTFKLGNRTDNHDYRPAQWASRVDIFAQADELDAEMSQLVEHFQEVANASRYPVERGYEHDVETMSPGICQQLIEAGSFRSGTGNNVCVFVRNFVSALLGHFAEVEQLCFKVLVSGAHACVNRGALRFGFCAKCCG
jgi:hypothetical protein